MRIYEYNTEVGTFEIREVSHELYELWIEEEKVGTYADAESAADDVAAFNTGYVEWDRFENEERNFPSGLGAWSLVTEETPG